MVDVDAGVFAYLVFSPTCSEDIAFLCHIHGLTYARQYTFTDWSGGCLDKTPVLDTLPMSKVRLHT